MHSVSYQDLYFKQTQVVRRSARGIPYPKWIDTGMPVIPSKFLDCVFYLYRSREDAESGKSAGGTGFFVAIPTEDQLGHHYAVTNWHVAVRYGFSVIRLNTADGGTDILEFDPEEWEFEDGKDDIAIVPLSIRDPAHKAYFIGTQVFLSERSAEEQAIGPGDNVFMIGRFMDIPAVKENVPTLRFGNISSKPISVKQPTNYEDGQCYCIDMHSRTGYSGSPVLAYRTPGDTLEWITGEPGKRFVTLSGSLMVLLGIHCGQYPEYLPIVDSPDKEESYLELGLSGKSIKALSGMTIVIPAWKIMGLLNCDKFVAQRDTVERERRRTQSKNARLDPEPESEERSVSGDDILKHMLNAPPKPITKSKAKRSKRGRAGVNSK